MWANMPMFRILLGSVDRELQYLSDRAYRFRKRMLRTNLPKIIFSPNFQRNIEISFILLVVTSTTMFCSDSVRCQSPNVKRDVNVVRVRKVTARRSQAQHVHNRRHITKLDSDVVFSWKRFHCFAVQLVLVLYFLSHKQICEIIIY